MRGIALLILLLLTLTSVTKANVALTTAVNVNWLPRTDSIVLESLASQRAIEISCGDPCFSHDLMRPGTAEVLAWNSGALDPIAQAIIQWQTSDPHDAILSDPSLTHIGCATHQVEEKTFFVCVLQALQPVSAPTPVQEIPKPIPSPPALLPNTAVAGE